MMADQEDWEARLDARLSRALPQPRLRPGFRQRLRRRISQDTPPQLWEGVPDVLHLAGCAVVTLICAAMVPLDPSMTLGLGVAATLASYVLMTAVRAALEDA
jgi:hypothetical protein